MLKNGYLDSLTLFFIEFLWFNLIFLFNFGPRNH